MHQSCKVYFLEKIEIVVACRTISPKCYIDGMFQHLLHRSKSVCQLQIASGIMGNRNSILTEKFKIRLFKMDSVGSQSR